jgi:hypothetical protein
MRIKYNNQTINIQNQSDNPKKEFFCVWNGYTIQVGLDEYMKKHYKKTSYDAWCCVPSGGYIVNGASSPTMREAVQECFDNMDDEDVEESDE